MFLVCVLSCVKTICSSVTRSLILCLLDPKVLDVLGSCGFSFVVFSVFLGHYVFCLSIGLKKNPCNCAFSTQSAYRMLEVRMFYLQAWSLREVENRCYDVHEILIFSSLSLSSFPLYCVLTMLSFSLYES